MINYAKGFLIGIGKIIPGISGSIIAIMLKVYKPIIDLLAHLPKINKKEFIFMLQITLGILSSITIFAHILKIILKTYPKQTINFFIGLILGTLKIPKITKKNIILLIISITSITLITQVKIPLKENSTTYFILGIIESISALIPGISSSAIFMSLGYYKKILNFFSNIFSLQNIKLNILFSLGLISGTIITSKILSKILNKQETKIIIYGFMIQSIIIMFIKTFNTPYNMTKAISSIIFFTLGLLITKK